MDFNEFCSKLDKLEIANKPLKSILRYNNVPNANIIIAEIDITKCWSIQNDLAISNKYEEALEIIKSRYSDFTFQQVREQAEYMTWREYILRFKDYIDYLCEQYNLSLKAKS